MRWVIRLVECNGSVRPLQVHRSCWSNNVHFSVNDFQSTFALDISKNHQGGIDIGMTIVLALILLFLLRQFVLAIRFTFLEALNKESTLSSGMLGENQISLRILLGVNVTR